MRYRWAGVILAVLVTATAWAADNGPAVGRSLHRLLLHDPHAGPVNYLLYVPDSYAENPAASWPLIVFLHGSEQRGTDPSLLDGMPPLAFAEGEKDFPFLLVIPQCPPNTDWPPRIVKGVLDSVEAVLRVDRDRVYLTGFSLGGYGTWQTAAEYPGTFAAIAPISGMGDVVDIPRLKGTPIWAFHGARDLNVPVTESLRMVAALRKAGIDARLTVYPDLAHDCWTITYEDSRLYLWFLDHTLSGESQVASTTMTR